MVKLLYVEFEVFPRPTVILSEINTDQLTFSWDSIATNLSVVRYYVSVSNCSVCPNTTLYSNFVRCNFINISNLHECSLIIQAVICGGIGSASDPLIITVKGQFT